MEQKSTFTLILPFDYLIFLMKLRSVQKPDGELT